MPKINFTTEELLFIRKAVYEDIETRKFLAGFGWSKVHPVLQKILNKIDKQLRKNDAKK